MTVHAVSFRLAALIGAAAFASIAPAKAQTTQPTSPTTTCPEANPPFVMPPEISSSGGVLKGTITLTEQMQRVPTSVGGGATTCAPQWVRVFQRGNVTPLPSTAPTPAAVDPMPGPTLRAKVGELVQLTFVNQVNSNRF